MIEIKAFIHRHRIGDVVRTLVKAGFENLSVIDVKGTLEAIKPQEQEYSTELGVRVVTEAKLELVCEKSRLNEAVSLIRENARTNQTVAGAIYVSDITRHYKISGDANES